MKYLIVLLFLTGCTIRIGHPETVLPTPVPTPVPTKFKVGDCILWTDTDEFESHSYHMKIIGVSEKRYLIRQSGIKYVENKETAHDHARLEKCGSK